ncbi:hypothetical protein ACHAXT_005301 [Thalassiosira profunda]
MNQHFSDLVTYFCLYRGEKNDFDERIRPVAEKLAHPDFTVHTGKGTLDRAEWLAVVEAFANGGGSVDMLSMKVENESLVYKVRLHYPDGTASEHESRALYKDGMLHRVQHNDSVAYNKFKELVVAADPSPVAAGQ